MRLVHIFTYGSLMFPEVWRRVVGDRYHSARACVYGYRRCVIKGDSYPVLVPVYSQTPIEGRIYFNVKPADCARLDAFEGEFYWRQSVIAQPLPCSPSRARPGLAAPTVCESYVLNPKYRHMASKTPWSPEKFERYHLKAFRRRYCNRPPVA